MTDILLTKIYNTFETYTQNIRPFLSVVLNHVHGIEHLDKTTLTGLLEQASDHTTAFKQNFLANYFTLLNLFPSTLDNTWTSLSKVYGLYLNFVRLTFGFTLGLDINKDDYPVLRTLMSPLMFPLRECEEKVASCYDTLQQFLVMTQPPTIGTMTIQTETEDQATQDNTPPTPSDTTRHPMAYPETKLDFEHDPELDSEDQNILAIESTGTLDNSIDNSNPTFDNVHNSSISDCTDIKQTDISDIGGPNESKTETIENNMQDQTDNINNEDQGNSEFESTEVIHIDNNNQNLNSPTDFNDHNNSIATQAETDNSHKESKAIKSEDEGDSKPFESESIGFDIDSDVGSEHDFEDLEAMKLQNKQEIRTMDFGPNLHTQVSQCAYIHAIKSNNLTCLNCKSPDHLVKDCPEPNKMQQPQSNKRQNNSIESAIEAPTQTL